MDLLLSFGLVTNTLQEHRWFFNWKYASEDWYTTHHHARSLKNIGINKENAIYCIKKNAVRCIDVGSLNGEYFNYVAAFGAFTNIPFTTSQKVKNVFGYFAYLLEGVKHLSDMKPRHIRFRAGDEEVEDDIVIGMVTNAFTVAGIINTHSNRTRLDDGLMEYLFIKMPQNILELQSVIASLVSEKIDDNFMYFHMSPFIFDAGLSQRIYTVWFDKFDRFSHVIWS